MVGGVRLPPQRNLALPEPTRARSPECLPAALDEAHRRYTSQVSRRGGWRGYLWQGRFHSFVMDEPYLLAGARNVELNPVRTGLAARPQD